MTDSAAYRLARAEDAGAFKDGGVVRAYRHRPPYPPSLIESLAAAVAGRGRRVLDLGCGTGDVARPLAALVTHVDAVDFSAEMLAAAKALDNAPNIAWHHSPAETFDYPGPYGLAVAGESLHWMDLRVVFSGLTPALLPGALFALVSRVEDAPWSDGYREIVPRYSISRSYRPRDLVAELRDEDLAALVREETFGPEPFSQTVEDYIELQHSRAAFSRSRMSEDLSTRFDEELRKLTRPFAEDGMLRYGFIAHVAFLRPIP